jgi:hypothetical protein
MKKRLDTKDPAEIVMTEFDYGALAESVLSATVQITVRTGEDENASAMLLGVPIVQGAKVLQRVQGGIDDNDYSLRCVADLGDETILIDAILPVRTRPAP